MKPSVRIDEIYTDLSKKHWFMDIFCKWAIVMLATHQYLDEQAEKKEQA